MEFAYSDKVAALQDKLRGFMDLHVYPNEALHAREIETGDRWQPTALMEELKTMPVGAVWDHCCLQAGVPVGGAWLDEIQRYERDVLSRRV